jgi:transaldolase
MKIKKFNENFEDKLTEKEKQSIRTLNFIAEFDGIIEKEEDIKYLLNEGIKKFIAPKRQYLVSLTETAYPIRIKY